MYQSREKPKHGQAGSSNIKRINGANSVNGADTSMSSFIGAKLFITGKINSDGNLLVEGRIQGDVFCNSITISENAEVNGKIIANMVIVFGNVYGVVQANNVILKNTACVNADIFHTQLSIESGANYSGAAFRRENPFADLPKSEPTIQQANAPETKLVSSAARPILADGILLSDVSTYGTEL